MAHINKKGRVVLSKKEAKALADLLSHGVVFSVLNDIGLDKLEYMLYVEHQDRLVKTGSWPHLANNKPNQ